MTSQNEVKDSDWQIPEGTRLMLGLALLAGKMREEREKEKSDDSK